MKLIAKLATGAGLAALILGASVGLLRVAGIDLIGDLLCPPPQPAGVSDFFYWNQFGQPAASNRQSSQSKP